MKGSCFTDIYRWCVQELTNAAFLSAVRCWRMNKTHLHANDNTLITLTSCIRELNNLVSHGSCKYSTIAIFSADPQADQGGATALQWGGGDAEVPAAPEHRPLPRLLEVDGKRPQVHHPGDRTHDLRHAQNVSPSAQNYSCLWLLFLHKDKSHT